MRFRTEVEVGKGRFRMRVGEGVVLMGSCFTDEIGGRLAEHGVPVHVNPCGVQYNPASIATLLRSAVSGKGGMSFGVGERPTDEVELPMFEYEGRERCWWMPAKVENPGMALCNLREWLREARTLIVTFGTASIYEHIASDTSGYEGIVGNCHKVPGREFRRRRLSVQEIVGEWRPLLLSLRAFNPDLRVIFTVSPIRHFKDGAHENTLSKATLHLAIASLTENPAERRGCTDSATEEFTDYFPAWELLQDDLRDYRFYAADMLHPSPVAADYIWEKFMAAYFAPGELPLLQAAARQSRTAAHRPLL